MEKFLKKLESIIFLCEELSEFQLSLESNVLDKAGQAISQKCGFFLSQGTPYSFMDEYTDEYRISVNLSKKSAMDNNSWAWARIEIVKAESTKKTLCYKVFISDEIWAEVDDENGFITPCIHMNDNEIFNSLWNQLEHSHKLIKELVEIDINKPCPLEHILSDPEVYFNLATEIKNNTPVYFQWVLVACEKDTILLKNLKEFILKDDQDSLLGINLKLSMTDKIDKLLLKNDLEDNLEDKKKTKLKKI